MGKSKLFYGYIVVIAGFLIQVLGFGIYSAFGVFFTPLLDEFGWSRATISGAASLLMVLWGLSNVIVGGLNDRFGPKITTLAFGVTWGLGYLLLSQVNAVWQFYLFYGILVGMGIGFIDVLPLTLVARWFVSRRGMMTGVVKTGAGLGIFLFPLIAAGLISNYGWRASFLIVGGIALVFALVIAQFLKRDPGQVALKAHGENEMEPDSLRLQASGVPFKEALRVKQFWMLCIVYLFAIFCGDAVIIHIVPFTVDLGIPPASAAGALAAFGAVSIAGRFVMGSAADRVGSRIPIIISFTILVIGLIWLQFAGELWMVYLFAAVYGFGQGGLYTVMSPWVAELFGLNSHGAIFGAVGLIGSVGGAMGPFLFGYFFDVTGSYRVALIIGAALCLSAIVLSLFVRPIARAKTIT